MKRYKKKGKASSPSKISRGFRRIDTEDGGHRYLDGSREILGITTVLESVGIIDPTFYTPESKYRGQAVHSAAHYLEEKDLNWGTVDPGVTGYLRAWDKFLRAGRFLIKTRELPVYNRTFCVACTPDRTGQMGKRRSIVEIKTGKVEPWAALQLEGQAICLGGRWERYAVELHADGNFHVLHYTNPRDRGIVLSAVAVANWKYNNRRNGR